MRILQKTIWFFAYLSLVMIVACSTDKHFIGGTATGFTGPYAGTVVLQNNGGDDLSITADGPFVFPTQVAKGASYDVTILSSPAEQHCVLNNGSGIVENVEITTLELICTDNPSGIGRAIGGTASGFTSSFAGPVVLQNNGGDDISISTNGTFTFPTVVLDGNTYDVKVHSKPDSVNCSLINGSGTVSSADITNIKLICSTGLAWQKPASYNDIASVGGNDAENPAVAMNASGDAVVAWTDHNSSGNRVVFMSQLKDGIWTYPKNSDDYIGPNTDSAWQVRVAMDNNGDAIIVWTQDEITNDHQVIFKSEYRSGTWTHPTDANDGFSPQDNTCWTPAVAMDNNGNAIIAWYESNGTNTMIYVREYREGAWSPMPNLLSDNFSPTGQNANYRPRVAMDDNGNAIVTWYQSNGSNWQIYKREYRSGAWSAIPDLSTENFSPVESDAYNPEIAMDDNGNAILVWYQYNSDSDSYNIYKREYRSGSWSAMPVLASDFINPGNSNDAEKQHIAMDNNGNAIIIWCQYDGNYDSVFKSEYRKGVWTNPATQEDHITQWGGDACDTQPDVQMDNNGNAVITWEQMYGSNYNGGDNYRIFKSEYRNNTWTNPVNIHDDVTYDFDGPYSEFYTPRVAMSDMGNAILVWYGTDQVDYNQIFITEYK